MIALIKPEQSATQGKTSRGNTTFFIYDVCLRTICGAALKFSAKILNAIRPEKSTIAKDAGLLISTDHLALNT
jgi:hypothetical protein